MPDPTVDIKRTWLIAFGAAAILYVATAAPSLIWGDSGDAQLRLLLGHFYDRRWLSRCHVLYYMLAHALTVIGLTPAYAATLLSAIAGAVTIGNVAALIAVLTGRKMPVVCGTALLLFSHCMWHIATVAEVMTCSTALLTTELLLVTRFIGTRNAWWLVAAWFVNGLGVSMHNFALLIWPAYAVLMLCILTRRSLVSVRHLAVASAAWLVGAAPFLALFVYLARQTGDPADVLSRMLTGGYVSNVFNTSVPPRVVAKTLAYCVYSFPSPLILGVFGGAMAVWRHRERPEALFLFVAFAVYFVFAARYNVPDQHVFLLHGFLFVVVFTAVGIDRINFACRAPAARVAIIALACLAPLVYAVVPEVLRDRFPKVAIVPPRRIPDRDPYTWFLKPWRCSQDGPERFARRTLDALPRDAVLTIDSTLVPPLLYLQNAAHLRRDVRVLVGEIYQSWFDDAMDIAAAPLRDRLVDEGRLFTATRVRRSWNGHLRGPEYDVVPYGPVFQFVRARPSVSN